MDYLATRSDIDGKRIACMGGSFGGYWAAKLAHTEPKRLRGAVNWGAGVHRTFQEEWLRPALTLTASQYLMGPASLLDARSYIFGVKSLEEVLKIAPTLVAGDAGFDRSTLRAASVHQRQRRRSASDQRLILAGGAR